MAASPARGEYNAFVGIWVTPESKERLEREAAADRTTLSKHIRRILENRSFVPIAPTADALHELAVECRREGVNLNQAVAALNAIARQTEVRDPRLDAALGELIDTLRAVRETQSRVVRLIDDSRAG